MDAWAALYTQLSGTYYLAYPYRRCAPSDQQQAVPVIPRTLEDTLRSRFIKSSDWMRRLATSVFAGESNSRMGTRGRSRRRRRRLPPSRSPPRRPGRVDVSRVSDQLTYPGPAIFDTIVRRPWRCLVPVMSCPGLPCLTTRSICGIETAPISVRLACVGRLHQKQLLEKDVFCSVPLGRGGLWISLFSGIRGVRPSPF